MRIGLIAFVLALSSSVAHAWGADGHRVVATIAQHALSARARSQLQALLEPGQTLADVSSFADEYRKQCTNTGPWHYVNIPIGAQGYDAARDCSDARGCVVSATELALAILADARRSRDDRALALRFAVHLVADLHQPLHSGDRGDRGGNALLVRFAGRRMNLHEVWDHALITWTQRSVGDYVAMLERSLTKRDRTRFKRGNVRDWVVESQRAARAVYGKLPGPDDDLAEGYAPAVLAMLDERLLRAGVRLAAALENALASSAPASDAQLAALTHCTARP